jgi:transcriptional regulator of arginine metabolism
MPSDHEHRAQRQQAIVSLLGEARVTSQGELVEMLRSRGIAATQSSVSRDLRDLGVAWIGGRYALPAPAGPGQAGEAPAEPGLGEVSRFLREARPAGPHLTVVTTAPGAAQGVAFALDRAGWPEVVGTLAGDDTLFAATATAADQQRLLARLRSILPEG